MRIENLPTAHFADLCEVTADVTKFKSSIKPHNYRGAKYYVLEFDIVLLFGLTELKAQIAWTENVGHRFSPKHYNVSDVIFITGSREAVRHDYTRHAKC